MKDIIYMLNWYDSRNTDSELTENMKELSRAFNGKMYANFTHIKYSKIIEDMVLQFAFKDTENVIKCLSCIHHISIEKAKLLLISKMSKIIGNLTEVYLWLN